MQAFHGVRVIDFTHVLAGPFCTYQLAVQGADVIKIEPPHEPDMMRQEGHSDLLASEGRGTQFVCQNGNKRSLSLDLNKTEGQQIIRKLIATADVLVENYRGGVLDRFDLSYEAVSELNPQIIYCSMTGFGRTGPKAEHPAYDNVIQAFSGLMAATGTPDEHPVRVGPAVLDYGTGAQAAFAIASALYQRTQTKTGQRIDVSMADAALMLMSTHVMDAQVLGTSAPPYGNQNPDRAAYSLYETRDGKLMLGAFTIKQTQRLWRALGREDMASEINGFNRRQFAKSTARHAKELENILLLENADHWEQLFNAAGVPAARLRRIDEAIEHPQIHSRNVLQASDSIPEDGRPLRSPVAAFGYQHDGPRLHSASPRIGEHSVDILRELGYQDEQITTLDENGVIKTNRVDS